MRTSNKSRKRTLLIYIGSGIICLTMLITSILYIAGTTKRSPNIPSTIPNNGPITIRGDILCLPHKNNSSGQTLECAYGLKDDTGRYFGLSDTDIQLKNISGVPMNVPITVHGTFTNKDDSIYPIIGVIEVLSIDLGEQVTKGVLVCLPYKKDFTGVQSTDCVYGLQDEHGSYFAIDMNKSGTADVFARISVNSPVSISGPITRTEAISSRPNPFIEAHPIDGFISPISIQQL